MVFLDEHVHELDPLHVPPANAIVGPAGTSAGAHTAKRAIAALIVATIVGEAILVLTRGQSDTAAVVGQSPSPAVDVTPKLAQAAPTLIPTPSASAVRDEMNPALVYGDCDAALRPFANALLGFAMWIGQTHTKAEYNTRLAALEPVYRDARRRAHRRRLRLPRRRRGRGRSRSHGADQGTPGLDPIWPYGRRADQPRAPDHGAACDRCRTVIESGHSTPTGRESWLCQTRSKQRQPSVGKSSAGSWSNGWSCATGSWKRSTGRPRPDRSSEKDSGSAPKGIRTPDLHLERVASWASRRWGHGPRESTRGSIQDR